MPWTQTVEEANIRSDLIAFQSLNLVTYTGFDTRYISQWWLAGYPAVGDNTSIAAGVALDSSTLGALNILRWPPASEGYINYFSSTAPTTGTLMLADRLWHNGNLSATSTYPQTINSVTFPARDMNKSSNGVGVYLAVEVFSATGAGTPTITASYTNSDGVSGRTATSISNGAATSTVGSFYMLGLQDGDVGVRSVQSLTLSATWTSGSLSLVAYRPISFLPISKQNVIERNDALSGGMPQIWPDSCLFTAFARSNSSTFAQVMNVGLRFKPEPG